MTTTPNPQESQNTNNPDYAAQDVQPNGAAPQAPQYNQTQDGAPVGSLEGEKAAKTSQICGIISLVVAVVSLFLSFLSIGSLIVGIVGLMQARKAKKHGVPATAGMVTSVIGIVLSIIMLILMIVGIILLASNPDLLNQVK